MACRTRHRPFDVFYGKARLYATMKYPPDSFFLDMPAASDGTPHERNFRRIVPIGIPLFSFLVYFFSLTEQSLHFKIIRKFSSGEGSLTVP